MLRYVALLALALWAASSFIPRGESKTDAPVPTTAAVPEVHRPERAPVILDVTDPSATALHRWFTKKFLANEGFGRGRMGGALVSPSGNRLEFRGSPYLMTGRRLIGAWLHESPRLYDSQLFFKNNLKGASWSALDGTDSLAMAMLKAGSDLVVDSKHSRMLGALRAKKACIECHEVPRGTLLGALRYDLTPNPPTDAPEIDLVPTEYTPK